MASQPILGDMDVGLNENTTDTEKGNKFSQIPLQASQQMRLMCEILSLDIFIFYFDQLV